MRGLEDSTPRRDVSAGLGSVMRYRSATVADSHGLPCVSGTETKNNGGIRTARRAVGKCEFPIFLLPAPGLKFR